MSRTGTDKMKNDTSDNKSKEKSRKDMEKEAFEPVPTSRLGDRVLRRRRKSRHFFLQLFDNIRRLMKSTDNK